MSIFAISQRWQEADKTAMMNATEAFIFKPLSGDARYIAGRFGLPLQEVADLEQFHFVHWFDYGEPVRDALPWAKKGGKK